MNSEIRIGILSAADTMNPRAHSGTPFYMARSLEALGTVRHLGPVRAWRHAGGRAASGFVRLVVGAPRPYHHRLGLAREYGRRFAKRLGDDLDVIVAPFAAAELSYLETRLPVIYTSDATIPTMRGYHPGFDLRGRALDEALEVEGRALRRADALVYPSSWAAESATRDYGVPQEQVHVIPFGANLPDDLLNGGERSTGGGPVNLLFIGTNWARKGGPVTYDAARILADRGHQVCLTICGCIPDGSLDDSLTRVIPRLDKAVAEQAATLAELYRKAHFLLLPTRNDAFGIVICEASAFGTPSLASNTGGVPGVLSDGVNGYLMPLDATGEHYADRIEATILDPVRYADLVRTSRARFLGELTWTRFADRVGAIASALLA